MMNALRVVLAGFNLSEIKILDTDLDPDLDRSYFFDKKDEATPIKE